MKPEPVLRVDEINLSDLDFWQRPWEEREGAFQTLRRERPLPFFEEMEVPFLPKGPGYFVATRHADILEASRNPGIFCSGKGATNIPDMPPPMLEYFGSLINMDDPQHLRLRKIVSTGFTPRRLAGLEAEVAREATRVIDDVIEKGECDFVTDISAPFPIRIICSMLGIPESQHQFVFDRTNIILSGGDPEYMPEGADPLQTLMKAAAELVELMKDLRKQRLEKPTDDLTSALVHAEMDGESLTEQELGSFFVLLVAAGNETTRNAISHGAKAFSDHPDQREIWRNDFEKLTRSAVEEIVRWATPVIFMRRTTTRPTTLGGRELDADAKIILLYASGNRDELAFDDPYRFDVRRWPNEHVGYGGPGPHFCLGANLARREIALMFRELFRRMPDLEMGPPDRLLSSFIHGIKHMDCRFTPGKREG